MSKKVDTSPEVGQAPSAPLSEPQRTLKWLPPSAAVVAALLKREAKPLTLDELIDALLAPATRADGTAEQLARMRVDVQRVVHELSRGGGVEVLTGYRPGEPHTLMEPRYVVDELLARTADDVDREFARLPPLEGPTLDSAVEHLLEHEPATLARLVDVLSSMPSPPTELAVSSALMRLQIAGRAECVGGDPPVFLSGRPKSFETVVGILAAAGEPMTFDAITRAVEREIAPAGKAKPWWAFALDLVGGPRAFVRAGLDRLTADGRVEAKLDAIPGLYKLVDVNEGGAVRMTLDETVRRTLGGAEPVGLVDRIAMTAAVERVLEQAGEPLTLRAIAAHVWPGADSSEPRSPVFLNPVERALDALADRERVTIVHDDNDPAHERYRLVRPGEAAARRAGFADTVGRLLERARAWLTVEQLVDRLTGQDEAERVAPAAWYASHVTQALEALVASGRAWTVHKLGAPTRYAAASTPPEGGPAFQTGPDAPTPPAPDVDVETALDFLDRRIVSILAHTLDCARALAECKHVEQLHVDAAKEHEHAAPADVCVDCGAVKLEGKDWRPPRLVAQLTLARSGKVSK